MADRWGGRLPCPADSALAALHLLLPASDVCDPCAGVAGVGLGVGGPVEGVQYLVRGAYSEGDIEVEDGAGGWR